MIFFEKYIVFKITNKRKEVIHGVI